MAHYLRDGPRLPHVFHTFKDGLLDKKLTLTLGLYVLSAARLSVAAPLINEPLTDHLSHTFVLIGNAN